jgi:hypothetical protein
VSELVDESIRINVVCGYVKMCREIVHNSDGSASFYGWSEHYSRDGKLEKTTLKELTGVARME